MDMRKKSEIFRKAIQESVFKEEPENLSLK